MEEDSSLHWLSFILQILLLYSSKVHASVTAIIVFGDSTVDAGNNNEIQTIAKSNFAPYGRDFDGGKPTGRFSNGRLATDFMAEAFRLKPTVPAYLDPAYGIEDFATGVTFASAATGYDNVTADVLSVLTLWSELDYFRDYQQRLRIYQGEAKARTTLEEALYVISMGTNDFLENYYTIPAGRSSEFTVGEYEDFLVGIAGNFISEIYRMGARKIDLTGLCPMGCVPLSRVGNVFSGGGCREDYNSVAAEFNRKLQTLAARLNAELPGIRIAFADAYGFFIGAIKHPHIYGFENAADGCCASGLFEMGYVCNRRNPFTCTDANKYLFWDAIHPSEKAYHVFTDYLMNTSLAQFL